MIVNLKAKLHRNRQSQRINLKLGIDPRIGLYKKYVDISACNNRRILLDATQQYLKMLRIVMSSNSGPMLTYYSGYAEGIESLDCRRLKEKYRNMNSVQQSFIKRDEKDAKQMMRFFSKRNIWRPSRFKANQGRNIVDNYAKMFIPDLSNDKKRAYNVMMLLNALIRMSRRR